MKTSAPKHAATSTATHSSFFRKGGQQDFFSNTSGRQPFFSNDGAGIQAKLTVGEPNDKYEKEADSVADKVVQRMGDNSTSTIPDKNGIQRKAVNPASPVTPQLQTKCDHCEEEEMKEKEQQPEKLQRKPIFESSPEATEEETVQRKCAECEKEKEEEHATPDAEVNLKCDECEKEEQVQSKEDTMVNLKCAECEEEEHVQSKKETAVNLKCAECENDDNQLQRKPETESTSSIDIEATLSQSKGSGSPLPEPTRMEMESSLGSDLSEVRIHNDSTAQHLSKNLHAQAFTHGNDIYFNAGKFDTSSKGGQHLLAHEITHTIQQSNGIHKSPAPNIQREPQMFKYALVYSFKGEPIYYSFSLSEAAVGRINSNPESERLIKQALDKVFYFDKVPVYETPPFLATKKVLDLINADLELWNGQGDVHLRKLNYMITRRWESINETFFLESIIEHLKQVGIDASYIDWNKLIPLLKEDLTYWTPQSAIEASEFDRYEWVLDLLEAEVSGMDAVVGTKDFDPTEFNYVLYSFIDSNEALFPKEVIQEHSEKFLIPWLEKIKDVKYAPDGFSLETFLPGDEVQKAESTRAALLNQFVANEVPELMFNFVLDTWATSQLDQKTWLKTLDINSYRERLLILLTNIFLDKAKTDPIYLKALRMQSIENAKYNLIRMFYQKALSAQRYNSNLQATFSKGFKSEMDPDQVAILESPYEYFDVSVKIASATTQFLGTIQPDRSIGDDTIKLITDVTAAMKVPAQYGFLLIGFVTFCDLIKQYQKTIEEEKARINEAIRKRINVSIDDIAKVISQWYEVAEQFMDKKFKPMLKTVALEWLASNKEDIRNILANYDTAIISYVSQLKESAEELQAIADGLQNDEYDEVEFEGETITKSSLPELKTTIEALRALADKHSSKEKSEEEKGKLQEALDVYEDVKEDILDDEFEWLDYTKDIFEEARRRLGIGEFPEYARYVDIFTGRAVASKSPFLARMIQSFYFKEDQERKMWEIIKIVGFMALSVAAMLAPGVGGLILKAIDVAVGLGMGVKGVIDAKEVVRMAKMDIHGNIRGISVEDAEKALKHAWMGLLFTVALTVGPTAISAGLRVRGSRGLLLSAEVRTWERAVSAETRAFLKNNRSVRQMYSEMRGDLRRLLTHCSNLCVIPGITRVQVAEIRQMIDRLGGLTPDTLAALRTLFYVAKDDVVWLSGMMKHIKKQEDISKVLRMGFRRRAMVPPGTIPLASAKVPRNTPGTAVGGEQLPRIGNGDEWLRPTGGKSALVPRHIADRLRNQKFATFDDMRAAFWREVANDPILSKGFNKSNRTLMSMGKAPKAMRGEQFKGVNTYELHHIKPVEHGGAVYDMDNLAVFSPRYHKVVHDYGDPTIYAPKLEPGYHPVSIIQKADLKDGSSIIVQRSENDYSNLDSIRDCQECEREKEIKAEMPNKEHTIQRLPEITSTSFGKIQRESNSGWIPPPADNSPATLEYKWHDRVNENIISADKIYQAFHGSMFSEEEGDALDELNEVGKKSIHAVSEVRRLYYNIHGTHIEVEFRNLASTDELKRALVVLQPAMSLVDKINFYDESWSENEGAMLDEIKNAPENDLAELRKNEPALSKLKGQLEGFLSYDEYYEAWKLLEPNKLYEQVKWRVKNSDSADDDEEAVYMAVLELPAIGRSNLWKNEPGLFDFLSDSEKKSVEFMCTETNTEAEVLKEAMRMATEGAGTYDKMLAAVVAKTKEAAQLQMMMEAELHAAKVELLESGEMAKPSPDIVRIEAELARLGNIQEELLTAKFSGSELDENTFLGQVREDVGMEEFQGFGKEMGVGDKDLAKTSILEAPGFYDDEDAIIKAYESISDPDLKEELDKDPAVIAAVDDAMFDSEKTTLSHFKNENSYEIALYKLDKAFDKIDTDEVEILRIIITMPPEDRKKVVAEKPPIYLKLISPMYMGTSEVPLIKTAFETGKVPESQAFDYATFGPNDEELIKMLGDTSTMEEMFEFRLGYYLSLGNNVSDEFAKKDARDKALARYKAFKSSLDDLGTDEYQQALDQFLGKPTPKEVFSVEGRNMASTILSQRLHEKGAIRDKSAFSASFIDLFSETGGMSDQAEVRFRILYEKFRSGDISDAELAQLAVLAKDFGEKYEQFVKATDTIADIASTVAAIVVALVVIAVTGPAGAAGVAATLAKAIGAVSAKTVVAAATAAALTKVATREILSGDHYEMASAEGAKDALIAAVDGALAAATAPVAQFLTVRFLTMVGMKGPILSRELTVNILKATEFSLKNVGRRFTVGGLEAGIDGVISTVVGEVVLTTFDKKTWEDNIWHALLQYGNALLKGIAIGGGGGMLTGGFIDNVGNLMDRSKATKLFDKLVKKGFNPEALDRYTIDQISALNKFDEALAKGESKAIAESIDDLQKKIPNEDFEKLKRDFTGEPHPGEKLPGEVSAADDTIPGKAGTGALIPDPTQGLDEMMTATTSKWFKTLNEETRIRLKTDLEFRRFWFDMDPDVRRIMTWCNTPCIPDNITPENLIEIKVLLTRLKVPSWHQGMREYLHMFTTRNHTDADLFAAIRNLDNIKSMKAFDKHLDDTLIKFIQGRSAITIRRGANGLWEYPVNNKVVREYSIGTHYDIKFTETGSFFQSHHGIMDAWAKRMFAGIPEYDRETAIAILLRTRNIEGGSKGTPHGLISGMQNLREAANPNRTFADELWGMKLDLKITGVPFDVRQKYIADVESYFKVIYVDLKKKVDKGTFSKKRFDSIFGDWKP
ncbi:MAG: DUF4157 domain-containing protein [Chitinophagaceae bacterium]|nr:DUF4157 domain-containing protein [Chitinophagaceae bacterium]